MNLFERIYQVYKIALEHYNLKYQVLSFVKGKPLAFASLEDIKRAIEEHALAYANGDKSIITDLSHKQLLGSILKRLNGKFIPPQSKAAFFIIEHFNSNLIVNYPMSRPVRQLFYMFSLAWFHFAVEEPKKSLKPGTPFQKLLELMLLDARRVDNYSGADVRHYCHSVFRTMLAYVTEHKTISSVDNMLSHIDKLESQLAVKRRKNSKRTIGKLRRAQLDKQAKDKVSEKVKATIGDGIYPIVLLDFIESYISLYLEDYYQKHGPKGEDWHQTIKDLSYLIWAFRADVDKNYIRYYPSKIPPAMHRLLLKVEPFVEDTERLYSEFLGLEDIIHARYLGEYIKLDSVFNAPYFSSESLFTNQGDIWFKENEHEGNWFHVLINNKQVIGRLLEKDQIKNQIVFLDYSGNSNIVIDTKQPDFMAADIQVVPLVKISDWDYLINKLDYEVSAVDARFCESYVDAINEIDKAKMETLEAQKKKEQELEKRDFELKQELIYQRQIREEKQRKAEERAREKAEQEAAKRAGCVEKVERIQIGAVIKAEVKPNVSISMQLNIITSTTKRFIFNDRNCQYRLALKKEEMVNMMIADKLRIESFGRGEQYHQTLASVIATRRNTMQSR